ncbi:MAG: hypothetical protein Ct9H90mP4_12940 [Gammaproteobacteria bacterium]|nr:MAG: hypothetical protein Ct9H90mP4_12940 [Gammaproteobacteria bacterium]
MFMSVYGYFDGENLFRGAVQPDGADILTVQKCFYLPIPCKKCLCVFSSRKLEKNYPE